MKAIRIKAYQNHANYRKEETTTNKMTYPLPPFSTIIGAIHNACNWDTYHSLSIGVIGKFSSIENRAYKNNSYLDNTMDDRGILVKCAAENILSSNNTIVAISKKRGSSFKKNIDIEIKNQKLYEEWLNFDTVLNDIKEEYKERLHPISKRLDEIKNEKSMLDKNSETFKTLFSEEKRLKEKKKDIQEEQKKKEQEVLYKKSLYKTMNTSLKYYELLSQVNLIIYIVPEKEEDMNDIINNVYNITSIGRAEDSVDILDVSIIDLSESDDKQDYYSLPEYCQYIDYNLIKDERILRNLQSKLKKDIGTIYYIPKNYTICDNKRIFDKKKVVFVSGFLVDDYIPNVYIDRAENIIINLF